MATDRIAGRARWRSDRVAFPLAGESDSRIDKLHASQRPLDQAAEDLARATSM